MKRVIRLVVDDMEELSPIMEAIRCRAREGDADCPPAEFRGAMIAAICRDYLDSLRNATSQAKPAEEGKK